MAKTGSALTRPLLITIALLALLWGIAVVRYAPPAPLGADGPTDRFSATRARAAQELLVGDGSTRWVGTEGNARARAVVEAELRKAGWSVELQRATSCSRHGSCAPVTNIIGSLEGRDPEARAVLLSAHYDSVPVSPGASDDGVGVAVMLEVARAMHEGPRSRRSVVILISDAEEAGLLGADAFVRNHPLAHKIATTINIDSRGSGGPSQMFETSRENAWLVSLMAKSIERPVTTSLFFEVYKRMPNDTDFSVTKTIASGVNFANTGAIEDYHTPLDGLAQADLGTLQHHGDHVLGMARAFAEDVQGSAGAKGDAVWFDVLALGIVRWPESWSKLFAIVAILLLAGQAYRARAFDRGLYVLTPTLLASGLGAYAMGVLLKVLGGAPAVWVAHPWPAILGLHLAAGAPALVVMAVISQRSSPRALYAGVWLGYGVLGFVTAFIAPGMSYLFIAPALVAAFAGALPLTAALVAPVVAFAALVFALGTAIYEALGFGIAPLIAAPTILLAPTIAPMLVGLPAAVVRKTTPLVLAAAALLALGAALAVPKFSATRPQRANVIFRQDADRPQARVFIDTSWGPSLWGAPPPAMLSAIGADVGAAREAALPWTMPAVSAAVPLVPTVTAPELVVEEATSSNGKRFVRAVVRSTRGAATLALFFPKGRRVEAKLGGVVSTGRPVSGGSIVGLLATPADGARVELSADGPDPIAVTALDRSFDVPSGTKAEDAVHARPAEAVKFQDGDVTIATVDRKL